MDEEKTLDEYYEELCEHYQENDNDVVEFLCNEEVPRGLTYEDVLQLYANLLHDTSDVDLFMVCDPLGVFTCPLWLSVRGLNNTLSHL